MLSAASTLIILEDEPLHNVVQLKAIYTFRKSQKMYLMLFFGEERSSTSTKAPRHALDMISHISYHRRDFEKPVASLHPGVNAIGIRGENKRLAQIQLDVVLDKSFRVSASEWLYSANEIFANGRRTNCHSESSFSFFPPDGPRVHFRKSTPPLQNHPR